MKPYAKAIVAGVGLCLCLCSPKAPVEHDTTICVWGTDTVTTKTLAPLLANPESAGSDSTRTVIQILLAGKTSLHIDSGVCADFAKQASLRSTAEWTVQQAGVLLDAAAYLRSVVGIAGSPQKAAVIFKQTIMDSVIYSQEAYKSKIGMICDSFAISASAQTTIPSWIDYKILFGISPETALLVQEFADAQNGAVVKKDMSGMVKGLLFDSTAHAVAKAQPVKPPEARQSLDALKFRTQKSITESISRHSTTLEAIYKKQLKQFPSMRGTVWVTFTVLPSGKTADAEVKRSEIAQKEFVEPLREYAKTIHFKEIPEKVGTMVFEYPFSFSSEE